MSDAKPETEVDTKPETKIDIATLTYEEKSDLLSRLVLSIPVAQVPLPALDPDLSIVSIHSRENLESNKIHNLYAQLQEGPFQPAYLYIQEFMYSAFEYELTKTEKSGAWWWKKTVTTHGDRRAFSFLVPRNAWEVSCLCIGSQNAYPSQTIISGDVFDGKDEKGRIPPIIAQSGYGLAISVKHNLPYSVPFRGLVVGRMVKPAPAPEPVKKGKKGKSKTVIGPVFE